jgi:hypothetical protein
MRFYYDEIGEAVQNGLREGQGQARNDASRSVSPADIDRLSRDVADLLEEMDMSLAEVDMRQVDEDDAGVLVA